MCSAGFWRRQNRTVPRYLFVAPLSERYAKARCRRLHHASADSAFDHGVDNGVELFALRLITGIGLARLASGVVLTGEYFPKHRRSTAITFIYCGFSFGRDRQAKSQRDARFLWLARWNHGRRGLALLLAAVLSILLTESLEYLVNRAANPISPKILSTFRRRLP